MPYARLLTPIDDSSLSTLVPGRVYILRDSGSEEEPHQIKVPVLREDNLRDHHDTYFLSEELVSTHFEILEEEQGEQEYDAQTRELRDQLRGVNARINAGVRSDRISSIMSEVQTPELMMAGSEMLLLETGPEAATPETGDDINGSEPEAATPDSQDEPAPGTTTFLSRPPETRKKAGTIRNQLHGFKKGLKSLGRTAAGFRNEIGLRMAEKMKLYQEHADSMSRCLKRVEGALSTVNLYLGRDEEITVIRTGARASEEEPLHIHQMVLRMDEEMAVLYPDGIDYEKLPDFDAWIQLPENLHAILPENKGIVVLVPSRRHRDYHSDARTNAMINGRNQASYWLLRNGENLYRIHADIKVEDTLFPRSHELANYFGHQDGPPPRPGSREYYRAMENEEGAMLHTLKLTLMLQGLLDRTLIFAPYAGGERPNLLDPSSFGKSVVLVRDGEGWISDGRPTFDQWVKENNAKLIPGDRIVGAFRPEYDGSRKDLRTIPSGADGANEEFIRTVIKRDSQSFKFMFDRTDRVYRTGFGQRSGPAKSRGSYIIYPKDRFFLNIDAISLEEIDYYISDRLSRSSYFDMMETLQKARRLKLEEAAAEAPFIALLQHQMKSIEKPGLPVSPELVATLVTNWKIKTQVRRALLSDEAKAFRMILSDYKAMAQRRNALPKAKLDALVAELAALPTTLRVSRELNGSFLIYHRANANRYFIHVDNHAVNSRGELQPARRVTSWTHVPSISKRSSEVLHSHPDLSTFRTKPDEYAIEDHRIPEACALLESYDNNARHEETVFLGITRHGDHVTGHYAKLSSEREEGTSPGLRTRSVYHGKQGELQISWGHDSGDLRSSRKNCTIVIRLDCSEFNTPGITYQKPGKRDHFHQEGEVTLNLNPAGFATLNEWTAAYFAASRRAELRDNAVTRLLRKVKHTLIVTWEKREQELYVGQGGDMEFWPDHKKTLPAFQGLDHNHQDRLYTVLDLLCVKHGTESIRDFQSLRAIFRAGDELTETDCPVDRFRNRKDPAAAIRSLRSDFTAYLDVRLIAPPKDD